MYKSGVLLLLLFTFYHCVGKTDDKIDCKRHKIYCAILELRPTLHKSTAMGLSNYIYKYSRIYGTDPLISVAIIMQESRFRNIVRYNRRYKSKELYMNQLIPSSDIGYYQFNVKSMGHWNLDIVKVFNDIEYATKHHCRILKRKMRQCNKQHPKTSWACWHSATPDLHKKYVEMVMKYYGRIND